MDESRVPSLFDAPIRRSTGRREHDRLVLEGAPSLGLSRRLGRQSLAGRAQPSIRRRLSSRHTRGVKGVSGIGKGRSRHGHRVTLGPDRGITRLPLHGLSAADAPTVNASRTAIVASIGHRVDLDVAAARPCLPSYGAVPCRWPRRRVHGRPRERGFRLCATLVVPLDWDKVASFLSDDCKYRASQTLRMVEGPEAIVGLLESCVGNATSVEFEIPDTWARGPVVANARP